MSEVIAVLTDESVDTILANRGTQSWKLDRKRAEKCSYVVIYRHDKTRNRKAQEPHGEPFLVGKVKGVVPSTDIEDRWLIKIGKYALTDKAVQRDKANRWKGKNPVMYWNEDIYDFSDFDSRSSEIPNSGLTIEEAKEGLAIGLKIPKEAIEITIRA